MTVAQEGGVDAGDHPPDALGQFRPVIAGPIAFAELVSLPIVAERLIVLSDVVKVFAERVAQADLVSERQGLCQQALNALQPGGVAAGHPAMRGDAAVRNRKRRVEDQCSLKELVRFRELAAIGAQLSEHGECFDVVRLDSECGPSTGFCLTGAPLHPQHRGESQRACR